MGPQSYENFKWKVSYNTRKGLKKEERIKEKWLFGSLILFFDDFLELDFDGWVFGRARIRNPPSSRLGW
ncbi:unnamed protein product [Rhizophagus irregularis]|nr:unnamed protein product [Rhizophagus irregularis]